MSRAAIIVAAAVVAGCGMGGALPPDAPATSDAPPGCAVDVQFSPADPRSGVGNTVSAHVVVTGASGFLTYAWTVLDPGGNGLPLAPASDAETVSFPIEVTGDYEVRVVVDGGGFCPTYDEPLHVLAPGAGQTTWRLRLTPPSGVDAPPQEVVRSIPSLPSIDIGDLILDPGVAISSRVEDSGGAGVAAYVKLTSAASLGVEAYAVAGTGALVTRAPVGPLEALVVPVDPAFAPLRVAGWTGAALVVDAGVAITGTVRDPSGAGLAGARVSIAVDGVPSTVGTTASDGTYTLRARPGAVTAVRVVPPDSTGLPELAAVGGAPGSPLDVTYDAGLATRSLAGTAITRTGLPAPGAVVTFTGTIAAAGSITMPSGSVSAVGAAAVVAVANGTGHLAAGTRAPARPLEVVVVPTPATAAVVAVDLTAAAPAAIDAPAMAPMTARAVTPTGDGVAGARLVAVPVGALAIGAIVPVVGVAAADGQAALAVAPGGRYDLVVDDPHARSARLRAGDVGAGALGELVMPPAMRVRGTIKKPGGGSAVRACAVQVFCYGCPELAADRPEGEASTTATGGFSVAVTDPGVIAIAPPPGAVAAP